MNKDLLRSALLAALARECENLTRAAIDARNEAIDEESRPQNKYDMHSQEAAYLAEGQARMAAELQDTLTAYQALPLPSFSGQAVDIGAVIGLEQKGRVQWYFYGPRSGGLEFEAEGKSLLVVTPQSPLGALLRGRREGDSLALPSRAGKSVQRVVSVV